MTSIRSFALLALACPLAAQPFLLPYRLPTQAPGQVDATRDAAFAELLQTGLPDTPQQTPTVQRRGEVLLVRADAEGHRLVAAALEELQRPEPRLLHLQVTVATMPAALTARHRLVAARPLPATATAITALLRDVQEAGGTLTNLPPVAAAPMQSTELRVRTHKAQALSEKQLALRALPWREGALVRLVHMTPQARPGAPPVPEAFPAVVLSTGDGILLTRFDGDRAMVVWLRLSSVGEPEPGKQPPSAQRPPPVPLPPRK